MGNINDWQSTCRRDPEELNGMGSPLSLTTTWITEYLEQNTLTYIDVERH